MSAPAASVPAVPLAASVNNVGKTYGATVALDRVSMDIVEGRTHALLGRNGAGKSTLVGIMTGLTAPDTGTVSFGGTPAPSMNDRPGWRGQVACVYQRSTVVPSLSVAENLFLAREQGGRGWLNLRQRRTAAAQVLEEWDLPIDPRARVDELPVGSRQLVEIARGLTSGVRFVILDEPTAKLDANEARRLFEHMLRLQASGVTFLYISHHLHEIYEVCQDVTVLRDGKLVATGSVDETPTTEIVAQMTGERGPLTTGGRRNTASTPHGDNVVLHLNDVSSGRGAAEAFDDVAFEIHDGEIVGLAGLDGSGKLGVAQVVAGLARAKSGDLRLGTTQLGDGRVDRAMAAGVGFVAEDRQNQGIIATMSVEENTTLSGLGSFGRFGFINPARRHRSAAELTKRLGVVMPSLKAPISELSGGNQQKVMLARAMVTNPNLLVLTKPTAGVDIKSKEELMRAVRSAAAAGTAVLVVSDELDDLASCTRVLVMVKGRLSAEFGPEWEANDIVAAMEGV